MQTTVLIEKFLQGKDIAQSTLKTYRQCLNQFFRWVVENGYKPQEIETSTLILYKRAIREKGLQALTIDLHSAVLKSFFRWLYEAGYSETNIGAPLKRELRTKSFKRGYLKIAEISKLLQTIDKSTIIGKRDYTIILLMFSNGLRCVEVSRISISDIEQGSIAIQGKGYNDKIRVAIDPRVNEAIEEYIQERMDAGENVTGKSALFINAHKAREYRGRRLTPRSIGDLIGLRVKAAGLKRPNITAHSLRHSAAVALIEQGQSLYLVQTFLRHSSAAVTQLYTAHSQSGLLADHKPQKKLTKLILQGNT